MAIGTYAQLKSATYRWLYNSDYADQHNTGMVNTIDDLITVAEQRIFREARTRDTEASLETVIAAGVIAVPSDYLDLKHAYIDGTPVQTLERRTSEWIYSNYSTRSASGKPRTIAREASNFIFGPYPDSTYTVKAVYYKKLAALSSAAHALFTNNPDLYLFGTLAEATIVVGRDDRIQVWEAKYQAILNAVNLHAKSEYSSGSPLQMRPG
jgi:hypothetical protein